ncbi:unnamed protein product [Arctogadus glacialis]
MPQQRLLHKHNNRLWPPARLNVSLYQVEAGCSLNDTCPVKCRPRGGSYKWPSARLPGSLSGGAVSHGSVTLRTLLRSSEGSGQNYQCIKTRITRHTSFCRGPTPSHIRTTRKHKKKRNTDSNAVSLYQGTHHSQDLVKGSTCPESSGNLLTCAYRPGPGHQAGPSHCYATSNMNPRTSMSPRTSMNLKTSMNLRTSMNLGTSMSLGTSMNLGTSMSLRTSMSLMISHPASTSASKTKCPRGVRPRADAPCGTREEKYSLSYTSLLKRTPHWSPQPAAMFAINRRHAARLQSHFGTDAQWSQTPPKQTRPAALPPRSAVTRSTAGG